MLCQEGLGYCPCTPTVCDYGPDSALRRIVRAAAAVGTVCAVGWRALRRRLARFLLLPYGASCVRRRRLARFVLWVGARCGGGWHDSCCCRRRAAAGGGTVEDHQRGANQAHT